MPFPTTEPALATFTLPSTGQPDGLPIQLFAGANPKTDTAAPNDANTDGVPVEVGLLFSLSDRAKLQSLRFWSSAGEVGSRRVRLWDVRSGALLKAYTVNSVVPDAWNEVVLPANSVILPAGQYILSVLCQQFYPARNFAFSTSQPAQGILRVINGVYTYETNAGFKFEQFSSFYYIEPIVVPTGAAVSLSVRNHIKDDPIFLDNLDTGDPNWKITNQATQLETAVYTNLESVSAGDTLEFRIHGAVAGRAKLEIHRLGYYNGTGAKLLSTINDLDISPQSPLTFQQSSTRLTRANWTKTHEITIPGSWRSGIYQAKVTLINGINTGKQTYTVFVVRNDSAIAEILFQVDTNTWDAYNLFNFAGQERMSLYSGTNGRAFKVSKDRPYAQGSFDDAVEDAPLRWNPSMVYFLERFGYRVAYCTNWDVHRFGAGYIQQHRVFLTNGHDEYWSQEQYAAVKAARDAGVNVINTGANTAYWRVRYEDNGRTVVCYKNNTHGGVNATDQVPDPVSPTVRLRDPQINDAECRLWGVQYVNNVGLTGFAWKATNVTDPLYQSTGFQEGVLLNNLMGYEWDNVDDQNLPPLKQGTQIRTLSVSLNPSAPPKNNGIFVGWQGTQSGDVYRTGKTVFFQNPSGAYIFSTGANNWSWGLAPLRTSYLPPDLNHAADDVRLQRLFQNILTEMKVWGAYPSLPVVSAPAVTPIPIGEVVSAAYRFGVPLTRIVPASTTIATPPYSLGQKFRVDVNSQLTKLMVYIPSGETGNHSVWLWDADTQTKMQEFLIASIQGAWVDIPVTPGISLQAGKNYLVSTNRNTRQVALNNVYSPPLRYGSFTYQGAFLAAQQNPDTYPNQALSPSPELFLWFEVTASQLVSTLIPAELESWGKFPASENIELGTRFSVSQNCELLGIALLGNDLKNLTPGLDFTLWNGSTQAQIQRVTQPIATSPGNGSALAGYRIETRFNTPIALTSTATYVASVNLRNVTGYLALSNAFANGAITKDIVTLQAGVFNPTPGAFPNSTFQNTRYSVDVIVRKTN